MRNLRSGVAGRGRLEERVGLVLRGVTLGVLLDLVDGSLLSRGLRFSDELLSLESGNAAGAGTGNGLAIAFVLDVTAGEDTLQAGVAGTRLGDDVSFVVEVDLALDQGGGGVMANSVEETVSVDGLLLAGDGVLDTQVGHQAHGLLVTQDLGRNGVETNGHLGVRQETVGHGLAGTKLVATDQNGNRAAVLGQEHGLFGSGVTTTDHIEGLVTEDWHGTVTDGTGADSVLPVLGLTGQVKTTGIGTSGDDDGIGSAGGLIVRTIVPLRPQLERPLREIHSRDSLSDNLSSEPDGLLAHVLHQLCTTDTIREAGEVLDVGGGGELTASSGAVSQHTLIKDRLELRTREIDRGGVCGGAGANDNDFAVHHPGC